MNVSDTCLLHWTKQVNFYNTFKVHIKSLSNLDNKLVGYYTIKILFRPQENDFLNFVTFSNEPIKRLDNS